MHVLTRTTQTTTPNQTQHPIPLSPPKPALRKFLMMGPCEANQMKPRQGLAGNAKRCPKRWKISLPSSTETFQITKPREFNPLVACLLGMNRRRLPSWRILTLWFFLAKAIFLCILIRNTVTIRCIMSVRGQ